MRILCAGGGTGGHINPALAVASYAVGKDETTKVLFVGTKAGLETRLVPKAGFDIEYIDVEGFKRNKIFSNVKVVYKLFKSQIQAKKILKKFKPDVVLATGGYVSGPVVTAAKKLKIPSVIHEQNVYPGLTVKAAVKYVDKVLVSFDETVNHIKEPSKCMVMGNPIRPEILNATYDESRKKLNLSDKPLVFIVGGSRGAMKINEAVKDILSMMDESTPFQLIFATGESNYKSFIESLADKTVLENKNINVLPYIHNMNEVMNAADVVVSRAGAITVSEIAALGRPCILIPSPNVVRNHQEQNARLLENGGGAIVITENELNSKDLFDRINTLVNDAKKREDMSASLKKYAKTDATEKIYNVLKALAKQ